MIFTRATRIFEPATCNFDGNPSRFNPPSCNVIDPSRILERASRVFNGGRFIAADAAFASEVQRFAITAQPFAIEAQRFAIEAERFTIEAERFTIEAQPFVIEAQRSTIAGAGAALTAFKNREPQRHRGVLDVPRHSQRVAHLNSA